MIKTLIFISYGIEQQWTTYSACCDWRSFKSSFDGWCSISLSKILPFPVLLVMLLSKNNRLKRKSPFSNIVAKFISQYDLIIHLKVLPLQVLAFFIRNKQKSLPPFILIYKSKPFPLHVDQRFIVRFILTCSKGAITTLGSLQQDFATLQGASFGSVCKLRSLFRLDWSESYLPNKSSWSPSLWIPNVSAKAWVKCWQNEI